MSIYKDAYGDVSPELALKPISPSDEVAELVTREVIDRAVQEARDNLDLQRLQRQAAINDIYNMVLSRVNSSQLGDVIDKLMAGESFKTSDLKNIAGFLEILTKIENTNVDRANAGESMSDRKSGVRMVVEFKKDEGVKMGLESN